MTCGRVKYYKQNELSISKFILVQSGIIRWIKTLYYTYSIFVLWETRTRRKKKKSEKMGEKRNGS